MKSRHGAIGQARLQQPLTEHRASHRQPGSETRPRDRGRRPLELFGAFEANGLVDDLRGRARAVVGFLDLAIGER